MLKEDGYDECVIGLSSCDKIVYDVEKMIKSDMAKNDWDHTEALKWIESNVIGSYMGEGTPIYVYPQPLHIIEEAIMENEETEESI